jgi:hypothetical protein
MKLAGNVEGMGERRYTQGFVGKVRKEDANRET